MASDPEVLGGARDPGEGPVVVEDPTESSRHAPFLYIPLVPDGGPWQADRAAAAEFAARTPAGVEWVGANEVQVRVRNAGRVASDLVWLDWQVRFCIDPTHGRDMGFMIDHAGEDGPDDVQSVQHATNISAGGERAFVIPLPAPDVLVDQVRNVYFRARISGLWTRRKPQDEWDFATDWAVTESCRP